MAFNPLQSYLQGQQAGQGQQIQRLSGALAGEMQQGGDIQKSLHFQDLMALDPDRARKSIATFEALDKSRKTALYEDMVMARTLISRGDAAGALNIFEDRIDALGGPSEGTNDSQYYVDSIRSGNLEKTMADLSSGIEGANAIGIGKALPSAKKEALQYKDGGIIFNPNTGEVTINEQAANRLAEIAQKKESGIKLGIKDKQSINKDITGFLKDTTLIHNTANDLSKLQKMPSGPASIALVFKFMKALDPTSVVREGEFSTAQNSAGVPEGIRNIYNKLAKGEILGNAQIQQFVDTAQGLSNSAVDSSSTQITNYLNTYGDDLPAKFSKGIMGRIPKAFEVKVNPKNITQYDENGNPK